MSYLVDTNVLVRLAQPKNPDQREAVRALRTLRRQLEALGIVPHYLVEFWAVATRPGASNGLGLTVSETSNLVVKLKNLFTLLPDNAEIFPQWETIVLHYQVSGKQVYDARLVAAMKVHGITHLLTFNTDDFKRYDGITVVSPSSLE